MRPEVPAFRELLGRALVLLRKPQESLKHFEAALKSNPGADAHLQYGNALAATVRLADAEAQYRAALAQGGSVAGPASCALGTLLVEGGRTHEGVDIARRATVLPSADPRFLSVLAFLLNYDDRATNEELLAAHRALGEALSRARQVPPPGTPQTGVRPPAVPANRRVRIGYLSANLRRHSVAFFAEQLFEHRDRSRFELFAYSSSGNADETTARFKTLADHWHDVLPLNDQQLNELVRSHDLDILVELGGHTRGTRIWSLVRQVAPVVITYCAYPNTTGLPGITHRLSDAIADPPEFERFYTEKIARLPGCFLCYRPPDDAPPVAPEPPTTPVFASFNASNKLTPATLDLWSRLLLETPGSRLLLKSKPLADPYARDTYLAAFRERGITDDRLEFLGRTESQADHLALYARCAVALDPIPYNGTTTTCEALYMGVPVVTLKLGSEKSTHASRVGQSLLHAVGLSELIATSPDDYVRLASRLATDTDALAAFRASLRARVLASALCDTKSFLAGYERTILNLLSDPAPAGTMPL
jgi:predicted O-linked N-acetylglucosamine transferase (SPINDLY family)